MADLLDIASAAEQVDIGGHTIRCVGISGGVLIDLLRRFPKLRDALMGGEGALPASDGFNATALLGEAPEAISAILAAGTGHPGEAEYEEAAGRIPVESQLDLLAPIMRMTLPQGIGPFVTKLVALFGGMGGKEMMEAGFGAAGHPLPNGKAPDTISPQPLNG